MGQAPIVAFLAPAHDVLDYRFRQSLAGRKPAAFASASLVKTRVQFRHVKFRQLDA